MKTTKLVIEKNIPMPETRGKRMVTDFLQFEVGDSALVPKSTTSGTWNMAAKREGLPHRFTYRKIIEENDKVTFRVWRVK